MKGVNAAVAAVLIGTAFAVPAPSPVELDKRQSPSGVFSALNAVDTAFAGVLNGVAADASEASQIFSAALTAVEDTIKAQATARPSNVEQAVSVVSSILTPQPTNLYKNIVQLAANGLGPSASDFNLLVVGSLVGPNSENNLNLRSPAQPIYPKKSSTDAPYSLTEAQLRRVIYIPPAFTYGSKSPVILVPGTGNTGYESFSGNYIPLLTGVSYADPVWLNIPEQFLGDAQINSEYITYAINYISGISSSKNVTVLAWSQGGLDTQWALKYWPSTRGVVSNFIANSPDFHGTVLAYAVCPSFPNIPCSPAIIQQEYNSNFVTTLRRNGGDSAYVPTTTIFSSTDEIVQPQSPVTGASAFLNDARNVGVSNNQVQAICGGRPAGLVYTHEGVLYNPLGVALAMDVLRNGGPGRIDRINLDVVCNQIVGTGLGLNNVVLTEKAIGIAAVRILLEDNKVFDEPGIKGYAA
ncbi:alpha/beta-hydrolase [Tothia fuscella]|uniref:Alpha/beta-hydrolase n=1 Tax=Tothia fuscella TaxID=1048955 RepID=A0A9P4NID5_9PEZI|nr:alpha/beta-hydrolase [Tothia fuscella]